MPKISSRRFFLGAGLLPFLASSAKGQETHFHTAPEDTASPGMEMSMPMGPEDDPVLAKALKQRVATLQNLQPLEYLTRFDTGEVGTAGGRRVREFHVTAQETKLEVAPGIFFDAWTYNGTVPGPTLRCTQGDSVRVHFSNNGKTEHTMHFHGLHAAVMDGVYERVQPGESKVYEFTAEPSGLQLYHCHSMPVSLHMNRGLYGALIIDPAAGRAPAKEMVMMLNGWDINFDRNNELYAINGGINFYRDNPIHLRAGELVRLYLVNVTEYDPVASFHIHANFFKLFRTGTSPQPDEYTDMVTLSQAERCILEFAYKTPGRYMFHPHQNIVAERGAMGDFLVS